MFDTWWFPELPTHILVYLCNGFSPHAIETHTNAFTMVSGPAHVGLLSGRTRGEVWQKLMNGRWFQPSSVPFLTVIMLTVAVCLFSLCGGRKLNLFCPVYFLHGWWPFIASLLPIPTYIRPHLPCVFLAKLMAVHCLSLTHHHIYSSLFVKGAGRGH